MQCLSGTKYFLMEIVNYQPVVKNNKYRTTISLKLNVNADQQKDIII